MWYDDQLRRGKTIVFGPETECKPRQFTDPGSVESGRDLEWADRRHDTQARAATWLMAPPAARLESPAADVGAGPAADAEERDLFHCLHWLRDLFGTLGGGGDEDSAGVPEPGELWNERYQVLEPLGSGAAGHVCLAYDQQMRRQVALKFPRVESGSWGDRREDLLRDAQMAARLDYDGILTVHELIIPAEGSPCLVMPYCRGGSLRAWLQAHPQPLDPRLCVRLLCDLAEAVQYAHDRRVVHRDLKPENILLQSRRGMAAEGTTAAGTPPERLLDEWQPRIADFGLAVVHDTGSSAADTPYPMGGTLRYMAPEQMRGEVTALGPATDVYALGVVLKELLVGQAGPQSQNAMKPARVRIPRSLRKILNCCLSDAPSQRYATAGLLADDLNRFLQGHPIHGLNGPKWWDGSRLFLLRERNTAGLICGLMLTWGVMAYQGLDPAPVRNWQRFGLRPSLISHPGIRNSGPSSFEIDPQTGVLSLRATDVALLRLGTLPPNGDLDLSVAIELQDKIVSAGVFFGYTERFLRPENEAQLQAVELNANAFDLERPMRVWRNWGYLGRGWDNLRFDSAMRSKSLDLKSWQQPEESDRATLTIRLRIRQGRLVTVWINDVLSDQLNVPAFWKSLPQGDLGPIAGDFGLFVDHREEVRFILLEERSDES